MADNKDFGTTVKSLFSGLTDFMTTKTVVGEAVTINNTVIIPLVEVSFGVGASAYDKPEKKNGAMGGLGAKMKPSAVVVINGTSVRIVPVDQPKDAISKIIDLVPEIMNKFGKKDPEVEKAINDVVTGE